MRGASVSFSLPNMCVEMYNKINHIKLLAWVYIFSRGSTEEKNFMFEYNKRVGLNEYYYL